MKKLRTFTNLQALIMWLRMKKNQLKKKEKV